MALTQPLLDKKILSHYMTIEPPEDRIQATYIWIDGSGEAVRCKTKTIAGVAKTIEGLCSLIHSVISRDVKRSSNFRTSILKFEFEFDLHIRYSKLRLKFR